MEKRINKKVDTYISDFKNNIKEKINELGLTNSNNINNLLQFIYDYDRLIFDINDFQKRKRVKTFVPIYDRCCALRANNEQCTRRKIEGEKYCGTHIKGAPNGKIENDLLNNENNESNDDNIKENMKLSKIEVWGEDIKGIVYYIDNNNNVYDSIDILKNSKNPRIIAKYVLEKGRYSIPELKV